MFSDFVYKVKFAYDVISVRTKMLVVLTCCLLFVIPFLVIGIIDLSYINKESLKLEEVSNPNSQEIQTLTAEVGSEISKGNYSEAFKRLATERDNFSGKFNTIQLSKVDQLLKELTSKAKSTTIADLYNKSDLTHINDIYKFTGFVTEVNVDNMYGTTYMVSDKNDTHLRCLEVLGLTDVVAGSKVEFYGVPEFYSVTGPMRVESYTTK